MPARFGISGGGIDKGGTVGHNLNTDEEEGRGSYGTDFDYR